MRVDRLFTALNLRIINSRFDFLNLKTFPETPFFVLHRFLKQGEKYDALFNATSRLDKS